MLHNTAGVVTYPWTRYWLFTEVLNSLRPRQNGTYFAEDIFKHIFLNENVEISIEFYWIFSQCQLKITQYWFDNGLAPNRRKIIIWFNDGIVLRHLCVTRPQWVNIHAIYDTSQLFWKYLPLRNRSKFWWYKFNEISPFSKKKIVHVIHVRLEIILCSNVYLSYIDLFRIPKCIYLYLTSHKFLDV